MRKVIDSTQYAVTRQKADSALKEALIYLDWLVMVTPTGPVRERLSAAAIHTTAAMTELEEAQVK